MHMDFHCVRAGKANDMFMKYEVGWHILPKSTIAFALGVKPHTVKRLHLGIHSILLGHFHEFLLRFVSLKIMKKKRKTSYQNHQNNSQFSSNQVVIYSIGI